MDTSKQSSEQVGEIDLHQFRKAGIERLADQINGLKTAFEIQRDEEVLLIEARNDFPQRQVLIDQIDEFYNDLIDQLDKLEATIESPLAAVH
jgi:hypothetical protein